MIKLGKETEKIYVEFETDMDDDTIEMLVNYSKEHILEDQDALVNYAFNRIIREQLVREGKLKAEDEADTEVPDESAKPEGDDDGSIS